ncbi:hypothetical protein PG990_002295 [Apiospora arundinis]
MQVTTILFSAFALSSPMLVAAAPAADAAPLEASVPGVPALEVRGSSCKTFVLYCGSTLKNGRGWTNGEIIQAVQRDSWNGDKYPTPGQIDKSLFKCAGQGKSLVWVNGQKECGTCVNGGKNSDYCG